MTTREIAKKRFDELNVEVKKCKTFYEFVKNYDCHNVEDDLADLNYKECCFTVNNEDGKPVLSKMVEVYNEYGEWVEYVDLSIN